ncbi:hypothetical protein FH972_015828 [Carpinus fangiana]|uniref:Uncharacterized protein n=1 Tax=Carpinus fangiana TaxID=176857 RepID=A0A5N6REJ6_9ROSI|nr:hypothetical protein FH972_015828 [Carpinus fangiana]
MEIVPSAYYESLKRYWRRRRYQRLTNGGKNNRRKLKIARLGGRTRTLTSKGMEFNINIVSPIKLLARFHDAYVDMMIRLASKVGNPNNVGLFGGNRPGTVPLIYKRIASTRRIAAS